MGNFENGENLAIIVACKYLRCHNWMAFASYYSISKNLPDAQVFITIARTNNLGTFIWPGKFGIKTINHNDGETPEIKTDKEIISISPSVMAIRPYNKELLGPTEAKSEKLTTFIDYSTGCGSFVMSEWINMLKSPFSRATKRFMTDSCTSNEIAVLKIWERISKLFIT
jgi:hypothetical protein